MAKIVKLLVLVLWQSAISVAMQGYLLTGPKSLLANSVETFCVSIEGSHPTTNCTLDLMSKEDDKVYATAHHRVIGPKDCIKLTVPVIDESRARLRLRMQFENSPNYTVDDIKEVSVTPFEPIHLIQTDKAWYTPGQLVRFRILSLNYILHPLLDPIKRIWVEDSTGTTVVQWTNLTSVSGLHQLELQLSVEPVQGLWTIHMERNGKATQDFEVREFVLPRFEVNINGPPSIVFNQDGDNTIQKILISVCAKYSYGQPVRGDWKANITATSEAIYWSWDSEKKIAPIHLSKEGVLNGDTGCYTMKLPGDQLGVSTYEISMKKTIKVVATVIEQGTGIESNATWSTEIQQQTYNIDIGSWSSNTFKRGLPYYGKIKVTSMDHKPAEGVAVEICSHPSTNQDDSITKPKRIRVRGRETRPTAVKNTSSYCSLRQVDANGFIDFELLPSDAEITEYKIKATISRTNRQKRTILPRIGLAMPSSDIIAETQFRIQSLYSPSNSFMVFVPPPHYPKAAVCLSVLPLKLYFTADRDINFNVHYMVMARGDVMTTGVKQVKFREEDNIDLSLGETLLGQRDVNGSPEVDSDLEASLKPIGDLEFEIEILPEWAPKISLLAYYVRDDKEVVTAHIDIPIENCFPNPVKLSWSSKKKQPGQNVTMNLKASPGSLCGYSVVDRSVTYARPDLQLTETTVYDWIRNFHISSNQYPRQVTPDWEYCAKKIADDSESETLIDDLRRRKRSFIYQRSSTHSKDAMEAFDNAGVLVMSDLNIETRPCSKGSIIYPQPLYRRFGVGRSMNAPEEFSPQFMRLMDRSVAYSSAVNSESEDVGYASMPDLKSTVAVRSYFPETWLWDLVTLNSLGESSTKVELPHTITTWVGRALCVSESHGFGMSSLAEVEAFQPFFLEMHLPYSVKRSEKLELKISVFNYAPHSLPIRLTLAYSEQFELLSDSDSILLCIPARNNVVHHYVIHAIEIGTHNVSASATIDDHYPGPCGPEVLPSASDVVIKELLVIPEGFPVERTHSHMACPKDFDEDKTLIWDLTLPDDVVDGSARAWVTAVGDLMGPALQGMSGLVRLPMGCGEQNMVLFTPNIYVTQYLEATNQLEMSIKTKAINFMKNGYQRELTYRHADGSFSAFGKNDAEGSLWLTAFVVKSFAAASRYIHIDGNELKTSVDWLQSKQLENGCFPVVGTVLHKDLKGGLAENEDNLAPLTAFTLISLLEMYSLNDDKVIKTRKSIGKLLNDTLPCLEPDDNQVADVYTRALTAYALALAGRREACRTHVNWLMTRAKNDSSLLWWEKPGSGPALNVEMTSYVLLTLVKLGSKEDLLNARSIVRWLSKQRNSEGGFVSTQDTVVALQAISTYAALIGTQPVDMELLVTAGEFENYVRIREHDRLVQRRIDLPLPLNSQVHIDTVGEGSGCVILQATLRYNVRTPPRSAAFHLNVTSAALNSSPGSCQHQLVVCSRYLKSGGHESNMALIEVGLVSGYEIDKSSLNRDRLTGVKRHEMSNGVLVLYFDQISSEKDVCVELVVQHAFKVGDAKDANVKIYDYYQPEHSKSVSYNLPNGCSSSDGGAPSAKEPSGAVISPLPRGNLESDVLFNAGQITIEPIDQTVGHSALPLRAGSPPLLPTPLMQRAVMTTSATAGTNSRLARRNFIREEDERNGFDLEFPDGAEAPVATFVLPDHVRGCLRCVSNPPEDFQNVFCRSKTIFAGETRPSRGTRLRLVNDFSLHHAKPIKMNSSVDLLLEEHCRCAFFEKDGGNRSVTIFGLPALALPTPPGKLAVGPELLIIDQNPKQLNFKSLRVKCDALA